MYHSNDNLCHKTLLIAPAQRKKKQNEKRSEKGDIIFCPKSVTIKITIKAILSRVHDGDTEITRETSTLRILTQTKTLHEIRREFTNGKYHCV